MENSFFIYTDKDELNVERFHICTWEFNNNSSLVEFGFEISKESIKNDSLKISIFIPWANSSCKTEDLYNKLSTAENSRFIFNDSIRSTNYLNPNSNNSGVIHTFNERESLCILPTKVEVEDNKIVSATLDLKPYRKYNQESKPNIYFRFWIDPNVPYISMRKRGISRSTIIYDIKVNERRNIPEDKIQFFSNKKFCNIKYCFSFNILPNKCDIVFFESASLKNVRTLEYESFNRYLDDNRVKRDELIVAFNKKRESESFSFFSIYSLERIGIGQFAFAILLNIICGILLFIPEYRESFTPKLGLSNVWFNLPTEIYIELGVAIVTILYFIWPSIQNKWINFKKRLDK